MSTTKRSDARNKGLRLAAKVATVGGFALAALGLAEARAAGTAPAARSSVGEVSTSTQDDSKPLPMESWAKAAQGGCGCSPCWGPPAPPARSRARARAARTRARKSSPRRARGGAR